MAQVLGELTIINSDYHKEIVRIAEGNPRIAIMTALLAKAKQNIRALHDVSELFENYFSTFIKDDGEFAKELNIKCLSLISFFYTIPYKDRIVTTNILQHFEIDYPSFIDAIDKLDRLELAELQFGHVKIPEQNLSAYFFYKGFIKDDLLSLEILLEKFFENNPYRFRDCVVSAYNTFGSSRVTTKLQPILRQYWKTINTNEDKSFKFLTIFWHFLPRETLDFCYRLVVSLPSKQVEDFKVTYEGNKLSSQKDRVIELLGEFLIFPENLKDALEIAIEYVRKQPDSLSELIHKIREEMTFDVIDQNFEFIRQKTLFQILSDGLNKKDILLSTTFYELAKTFMAFKFHHTKGGRNRSIQWYDYPIPNVLSIQQFRTSIWETVESNFEQNPRMSFEFLKSYATVNPDASVEIMQYEISFLVQIIDKYLLPNSFHHRKYVHEQFRWCKRNSVSHPLFESILSRFTNKTYEIYIIVDWNRLRDKEMLDFDNYEEYAKLKETEIRNSFVFSKSSDITEFYDVFIFLKKQSIDEFGYLQTLEFVVDENLSHNFELGCQILTIIIQKQNELDYVPQLAFRNHLNNIQNLNRIWTIIQGAKIKSNPITIIINKINTISTLLRKRSINFHTPQKYISEVRRAWDQVKPNSFNLKANWELSFFSHLAESLLSSLHVKHLITTIKDLNKSVPIHFDLLKRFAKVEPDIIQIIIEIVVKKNDKEEIQLQLSSDLFTKHFQELGCNINLIKKAYLQQDLIYHHFDYDAKGLFNILQEEKEFLFEYINQLFTKKQSGISSANRNLTIIWQIADIETILIRVFDLIILYESYNGILDHFCNSFFRNTLDKERARAKTFLFNYCELNFSNPDKMNVLIDIVRHSVPEIFNEILLQFVSLTQDRHLFSQIMWRGNGGSYMGDVIIGDIHAAEWKSILATIEKSNVGIALTPIKQYINEQIEYHLKSGDWERQRRFIDKSW